MDLWFIIKERYMFLSIPMIIIIGSLFIFLTTWKKRSNIPKILIITIALICLIIIVLSILALLFIISFGYNA